MLYRVTDQLVWGGWGDLKDAITAGCNAVINVGIPPSLYFPGSQFYRLHTHDYNSNSVPYPASVPPEFIKTLYFHDNDPFPVNLVKEAVKTVEDWTRQGRRVFVHCLEGNSRSVTVIFSWLVKTGMSIEEAEKQIIALKPCWTVGGHETGEEMRIRGWVKRDLEKYLE